MHRIWTQHEIETLTDLYHLRMTKELTDVLPGRTLNSIFQKARSLNLKANRKLTRKQYLVDYSYFSVPKLENSYWAGFIAADGNIGESKDRVRIKLLASDSHHLEAFRNDSGSNNPIIDVYNGLKKYVSLEICGVPRWKTDLQKNFCITPRKSLTLQPPKHLSKEHSLAFITGYIDGDGCIFMEKPPTGHLRIGVQVTGTHEVLCWVKSWFDKIAPSEYQASARCIGNIYSYKIVGKKAESILRVLFQTATPKLERKWAKVSTFFVERAHRRCTIS
ncbi:MAG: hypothetical protein QOJ02_59 [Acidobacteriota bacterium]|jgi:hypothetical protein|nr:hypothetical protein [Acidobacteriota bacterium]